MFVRLSTVLGERGSADTARDVRGFAVKFYTDKGNWDLVGNNIPVFFIQDAMEIPQTPPSAPSPDIVTSNARSTHRVCDLVTPLQPSTITAYSRSTTNG